jgi:hypothetical protein
VKRLFREIDIPVEVLPEVWITRTRNIRVCHDLQPSRLYSENNIKKGKKSSWAWKNKYHTRVKKDLISPP